MIICEECGNQNDSTDTFCGSCGAFLEWQGQRVEEPAPEPEPEVEETAEEAARPGIVQRVKTAIGIEDQPGGGGGPAAAGGAGPGTDEAVEAEEARRLAAAERAGAEEAAERARREAAEARAEAERAERLAREQAEAAARAQREAEARAQREHAAGAQAETEAARREAEAEAARREAEAEAEAARRRAEEVAGSTAAAEAAAERARAEEARREEAARRAAAMVAQPRQAPTPPSPPAPAAVRPTEQRQRPAPRQPAAPAPVVKPGDLICGQCGEGNDPARNFCRRCGHTLATALVARVPWYRRVFSRRKKAVPAGARPGRAGGAVAATTGGRGRRGAVRDAKMAGRKAKSVYNKFRRVAALLVILGVGLAFLGPFREPANRAYQSVRRVIKPEFEPVRPVAAVASSSAPGRDPTAVIDGIKNTFWAEGAPGPGDRQTLTVTFSEPTDLDKFGIIPGASENPAQFVAQPRPRTLHLVFDGTTPSAKDVAVKDSAKFQSFDLKAKGVTSVLVEIVSVHASTGGEDCAITELEFFRKK
ncbi:MAG: NADase-type glycan-binding domain-containing protein [Actinomycetota bacterium]